MWFEKWFDAYRMRQKIKKLSYEQRQYILEKSPLDAGYFQGEGFHVFLKGETDFQEAYVISLGEISGEAAEDWVINQYLEQHLDLLK